MEMNVNPDLSVLISSIQHYKKGTMAKKVQVFLDKNVNIGGDSYEIVDTLPDVKDAKEGIFYIVGETINYIENGEWHTISGGEVQSDPQYNVYIQYYPNWEKVYTAEHASECTVKSVDVDKLEAFVEENDLWDLSFDYEDGWGEYQGQRVWRVNGGMMGEIFIPQSEMLEKTGIDVDLASPDTSWASFYLQKNFNVDTGTTNSFYAKLSSLSKLCSTTFNQLLGPFDKNGEEIYIPNCAFVTIQISGETFAEKLFIPNYFGAYMVRLVSCSFPLYNVEAGSNVLYYAGSESDGLASVPSIDKVGDNFMYRSKLSTNYISIRTTEVGDNFMLYATYSGSFTSANFYMNNLRVAGSNFLKDFKWSKRTTQYYFPVLETVGDAFMHNTLKSRVECPILKSAGSSFLAWEDQQEEEEPQIIIPALQSLGDNAFVNANLATSKWEFNELTRLGSNFMRGVRLTSGNNFFNFPKLTQEGLTGDWQYANHMFENVRCRYPDNTSVYVRFPKLQSFPINGSADTGFTSYSPSGNPLYDPSVGTKGGFRFICTPAQIQSFHQTCQQMHAQKPDNWNAVVVTLETPDKTVYLPQATEIPNYWRNLQTGMYFLKNAVKITDQHNYEHNILVVNNGRTLDGGERRYDYGFPLDDFSGDWDSQLAKFKIGLIPLDSVGNGNPASTEMILLHGKDGSNPPIPIFQSITMTTNDPGEGAYLEKGNFIGVYE